MLQQRLVSITAAVAELGVCRTAAGGVASGGEGCHGSAALKPEMMPSSAADPPIPAHQAFLMLAVQVGKACSDTLQQTARTQRDLVNGAGPMASQP